MSYTKPPGDAGNFQFAPGGYARPDGSAANFSFAVTPGNVDGIGSAQIAELEAAGVASHGISGAGMVTVPGLIAAGVGEIVSPVVEAIGNAVLGEVVATGESAHGIGGASSVTLGDLLTEGTGAHGVGGSGAVDLGPLVVYGAGAHGVAGSGEALLPELLVEGHALHPRYELRGEVRDAGVLVNRTVRAHRRDTGALIGEQFTVAGRFNIHAGFVAREHYILPIDLDDAATDWTPPAANRVLSVLAED